MSIKLRFEVEKLDNGYLVNMQYQPKNFKDTEFKNYFFDHPSKVESLYAEYLAKLAQ
jgi:hypothetical protein